MIKAQIIEDSLNPYTPQGNRLTTFKLTYPRFIHSELMTHRVFSRNAASSRAIPIEKVAQTVTDNPAFFERLVANEKGMQGNTEIDPAAAKEFTVEWFKLAKRTADWVREASKEYGLHKQILNRVLEPFTHITVIVSATEWMNFFRLRAHKDAQPEFQVLAYRMLDAYLKNKPVEQTEHLPFFDPKTDATGYAYEISVARCARVSYHRQDDILPVEKDIELFNRLKDSGHWSPFEHVAIAAKPGFILKVPGNFNGWRQIRHEYDPPSVNPHIPKEEELAKILELRPSWVTLED